MSNGKARAWVGLLMREREEDDRMVAAWIWTSLK